MHSWSIHTATGCLFFASRSPHVFYFQDDTNDAVGGWVAGWQELFHSRVFFALMYTVFLYL